MTGRWVPHDTRDAIVDYVRDWSEKAEVTARRMLAWLVSCPRFLYQVL
jgi:hypothetical protein